MAAEQGGPLKFWARLALLRKRFLAFQFFDFLICYLGLIP